MIVLVLYLSYNFFQHILQCYYTTGSTIFTDNNGHLNFLLLEFT